MSTGQFTIIKISRNTGGKRAKLQNTPPLICIWRRILPISVFLVLKRWEDIKISGGVFGSCSEKRSRKIEGVPESVTIFKGLNVRRKSVHSGGLRLPQRSSVRFLSESNVWQTWNTKRQAFNVKKKNPSHIRRFMGYGNQISTVSTISYYYHCEIHWWLMKRQQPSEITRDRKRGTKSHKSSVSFSPLSSNNRSALLFCSAWYFLFIHYWNRRYDFSVYFTLIQHRI